MNALPLLGFIPFSIFNCPFLSLSPFHLRSLISVSASFLCCCLFPSLDLRPASCLHWLAVAINQRRWHKLCASLAQVWPSQIGSVNKESVSSSAGRWILKCGAALCSTSRCTGTPARRDSPTTLALLTKLEQCNHVPYPSCLEGSKIDEKYIHPAGPHQTPQSSTETGRPDPPRGKGGPRTKLKFVSKRARLSRTGP